MNAQRATWLVPLVLVLALAACGEQAPQSGPRDARAPHDGVAAFLDSHWGQPRKAQAGTAAQKPAQHDSLAPGRCGACHGAQLEDWRGSLHSRAMGPGIAGQLITMNETERADCTRCHAPLQEQSDPRSELYSEGLVCAACHMRNGEMYGPARRDGSTLAAAARLPHGGWTASGAFEDARFCAGCHQFENDGYALNGKLLENTFQEWQASRHAREGRSCQSCHMPERRHLWRGIHDPEMARRGLAVQSGPLQLDAGTIKATWQLANTGTGHFFPTYVTPRVVVTMRQETAGGEVLEGTLQQRTISREVTPDLSKELADTRIAPDEKRMLEYSAKRHRRATHLAFEIRVEPDAFYTQLYRSLLKESPAGPGRAQIAQALRDSLASHYTLYAERQVLRELRHD